MSVPLLCNLVIPGAAKSGTSALHDSLARHPNIDMSDRKEPHFFSIDATYAQGPQSHNALFTPTEATRYFGESSTGYMISEKALARIATDLVNPKIIFLLRHPVDRSFSHYRWRYRLGLEKRSFSDALRENGYGYEPEQPKQFGYESYLQFSQYARYCPLWVEAFGAENCLFVRSERLRTTPDQTEARIYAFLELPDPGPQAALSANETVAVTRIPSKIEGGMASRVPKVLRRTKTLKSLWNVYMRTRSPVPPKLMTEVDRLHLESALADDIAYYESMAA